MLRKNRLGSIICKIYQDVVSPKVQYDAHVKQVLSERHILAWICLGGTERGKDKGEGLIGLLNTLLSPDMDAEEKIKDLEEIYKLPIKQEIGKEFGHMCNLGEGIREKALADGIERGIAQGVERGIAQGVERGIAQGVERGIAQGLETALQAMVQSLKDALPTFDDVYKSVTQNEIYKDVTEEQVRKYYL